MRNVSLLKCIGGVLALASTLLVAEVHASDATLPSKSNDVVELEKAMDELEQALVLVKRIEENKKELGKDSVSAKSEQTISKYQSTDEQTDQDKLIAQMAKRLNDSAGLSNQDGSVTISGICFSHQEKLILKDFVEGIRDQLTKITGLKFPSSAYRILVIGAVPKSREDDTKTAHYKINIVPDAMPHQDAATIELIILHPKAMDSHEFAANVIRGYFALYTHVTRKDDYEGISTELPKWFINGLARQIDFSVQQKDINNILYLWSKALIPTIDNLIEEDSTLTQTNDAIASALVGFWLDCDNFKDRVKQLFTELANGAKWSSDLYRKTIRSDFSMEELDVCFDFWILAQRFKILSVGTSSECLAERIITHLMLVPGSGSVPDEVGVKWVALHPSELAKFKNEPWAKKLAEKNQRFILVASTGRNDKFRVAAAELGAFYQEIIAGKATEAELRAKYAKAEKMLFEAAIEEK